METTKANIYKGYHEVVTAHFYKWEKRSLKNLSIIEKIITQKKILIRVHGSEKIGLGHVYNMLIILKPPHVFLIIVSNLIFSYKLRERL